MEGEYNIFKVLKLQKKESFHSAMIVAILEHDEKCRNAFFEMLNKSLNSDINKNKNINPNMDENAFLINDDFKKSLDFTNKNGRWIHREVRLNEKINKNITRDRGRADIWIGTNKPDVDEKYRLIIENKINAGNQYLQLRRYYRYLTETGKENKKRKNAGLFYLCLKKNVGKANDSANTFPSESNGKEKDLTKYAIITYEDDIIPWLKDVIEESTGDFKKVVSDYLELVNSLVDEKKKNQ